MKKHLSRIMFIIICICLAPVTGFACTAFMLDNGTSPVVGKNFDWHEGEGLVMVNKRNVEKTGIIKSADPAAEVLSWTSRFGSVTFNIFSREMAFGGMNEAGLVIESLGLPSDKNAAPQPDARPMIYPLQWAQYQLDNFSTVDEVINSDSLMRMPPPTNTTQTQMGIHFFVCDKTGICASIEFQDGKMVYHTGETMPVKVLTNSTYDKSIPYLGMYKGFGGFLPIPLSSFLIKIRFNPFGNTLPRFVCAADMVQKFEQQASTPAIDYAFEILSSVAQPKYDFMSQTQWRVVYDIANLTVYFQTLQNDKLRYFHLSSFDFSCSTPVTVLDVNADLSGDVASSFIDYTDEMNRDLFKAYAPTITDEILDLFEKFIKSLICVE